MTETAKKEWVGFSPNRVWQIAANTFTESVRQKVFYVLLVFALVVIACVLFFRQFDFGEEFKFVKDFCLGAISIFGTCIAIVGTSMLLPNEVEHRTIYTILSKPVRRFEFLFGKYVGSLLLVFVSTVLMSLMFGVVLYVMMIFSEGRARAEMSHGAAGAEVHQDAAAHAEETAALGQTLQKIRAEAMDPDIVKGVLLIFVKLCVLAAVTLAISTISTSMVFNVVVSFMVFIAGHLVGPTREKWGEIAAARWALAIIPDFGMFNVADDIVLGNAIPWLHTLKVVLYGVVYVGCLVAAAHFVFENREI